MPPTELGPAPVSTLRGQVTMPPQVWSMYAGPGSLWIGARDWLRRWKRREYLALRRIKRQRGQRRGWNIRIDRG